MEMNCSVLVVDDDKEIAMAIKKMLTSEGYKVLVAFDGLQALDVLINNDVQLILLDVMMPRLDGLSTTMKIRENKNIPIIILSAKSEDSDKILGLSMGADDYITKPFNPLELVARVRSHLRRYVQLGSFKHGDNEDDGKIIVGGLCLDTKANIFTVDGIIMKLTVTEYNILNLLMSNAGTIFSAEKIYNQVWKEDAYSVENTVMVHIRHIREKIEVNPKEPKYLKVVWGIGYKIEEF